MSQNRGAPKPASGEVSRISSMVRTRCLNSWAEGGSMLGRIYSVCGRCMITYVGEEANDRSGVD